MEDEQKYEKELAIKNIRAGVVTGLLIFGVFLGKFLIAQFADISRPSLEGLEDPWILLDLVIFFLLIWGVTRYSRTAAVLLFLYYLAEKIFQFLESGSFVVLLIGSIILFFFARAIKGTFDYHNLMKRVDPQHQPTKRWMWVIFTPVVLVLGFFITVGVLSHYEIFPAGFVKAKHQITEKDRQALLEMYLIDEPTEIEFFYSYGLFSLREGGVLMTDQELIIFAEQEGEIYYDSLRFEEIEWVKRLHTGNEIEDSLFQVSGVAQYTGFQFELSTADNGDTMFYQKLENKIYPVREAPVIPMPDL